mmetsp:Transcript_6952/g.12804  ORF Transcript_6952/g.12804 Transcript_6952/m.12804 type:complete len:513 (+) Transcript_6952:243-1781(+)
MFCRPIPTFYPPRQQQMNCFHGHVYPHMQKTQDGFYLRTKTCAFWVEGRCEKTSNECSFLHAWTDPEKQGLCKYHLEGRCPFPHHKCRHQHLPVPIVEYIQAAKCTRSFEELSKKLESMHPERIQEMRTNDTGMLFKLKTCRKWLSDSCDFGQNCSFLHAPTDPSKKGGLCAKSINGKCYYTGNCCSFQHLPEGIHSLEEYERASEGCKTFPELMRKLGRKKTQKSSLMSLMAGKVGLSEEDSRMLSNDSFKSMRTATGATGSVSGNRSPASSAAPGPAQDDWLSSALMSKVKIINDSPLLSLGSPALKTGSYLDSIKSSGSGSSMVAAISKKENNMNASSPSLSGMKPRSLLPFLSRNVGTNSLETDTNSASSTLSTAGSESDTEKEHDSATSSGRCVKRFASMVGNKGAKASCDNIKADRDESESEEMRQLREKAMATWNSEDVHTFVKSMGESEVWQACAQQMLESSIDGSILRDYASVELLAEDAEDYGLKNKAFVRKLSKAIQRWGA